MGSKDRVLAQKSLHDSTEGDGKALKEESLENTAKVLHFQPKAHEGYIAYQGADMKGFPGSILGDTTPSVLIGARLSIGGSPGGKKFNLSGGLEPPVIVSCGLTSGDHQVGTWTPGKYGTTAAMMEAQRTWAPMRPKEGTFTVYWTITEEAAQIIADNEGTHVADLQRALELSMGALQDAVHAVNETAGGDLGEPEMMAALVNRLLRTGKGYIVPRDPDDLKSWGPHVKTISETLSSQSSGRDSKKLHSPQKITAKVEGNVIRMVYELKKDVLASELQIITDDLTPFDFTTYEAYSQAKIDGFPPGATFEPGQVVELKKKAPLADGEWRAWKEMGGNDYKSSKSFIKEVMEEAGGVVVKVENREKRAWIELAIPDGWKIDFGEWSTEKVYAVILLTNLQIKPN